METEMKGVEEALEHLGIFRGGILTPDDFADLVEGAGNPVPALEGWGFTVPMSKAAARAIRRSSKKLALSAGVFESPLGLLLLVVTLQAASTQVRIVSDLTDLRIQQLLRWSLERGTMTFLCGARSDGRTRLVVHGVEKSDISSLLEHTPTSCSVPFLHHAVEMASAAWILKEPGYIDSSDSAIKVREVSVCTILPNTAGIAEMAGVAGAEMTAMTYGTAPTVH